MRIDSHAHGWWGQEPSPDGLTAYIDECRRRGIDKIVLITAGDALFDTLARCPDFVIPVAQVDIDAVTPDDLSRLLDRGAKGIKFIGPLYSYGDDRYFPLYERILRHRATVVFHTGYLMVGLFDGPCRFGRKASLIDIVNMRPAAIDRIVRGFPELKILMAHFGNPWWEEAWKMISSHANVYADLSGGTACRKALSMWAEMFAPDGVLDAATVGKLCFGSDTRYFLKDRFGFESYIQFHQRLFDRLGLPEALRKTVNSGNVLALF